MLGAGRVNLFVTYDYFFRSLGGKLRIGLAEQSVLTSLGHSVVYTPPDQTYPPVILDASESLSTDEFKKELDSAALTIKTAYCELPTYNVIIPKLLENGWKKLPETCHITPGRLKIESSAAKIPIESLKTTQTGTSSTSTMKTLQKRQWT